jgi:hypothetical protein
MIGLQRRKKLLAEVVVTTLVGYDESIRIPQVPHTFQGSV